MDMSKWRRCTRERFAAGLCLQCGNVPVRAPHRLCLTCRKEKRRLRQILYDSRLAHGVCPVCGKGRGPDELIYCTTCREKQNGRNPIYAHTKKARHRANNHRHSLRIDRWVQELCTDCGQGRENTHFSTCERCRQHSRDNYRKRQEDKHVGEAVHVVKG